MSKPRSPRTTTPAKARAGTRPAARTTPPVLDDRLARLKELFPESVTEGKIDFDDLKTALGEEIDSRPERYSFTWAGKKDAIRVLQAPTTATLTPDPKRSVGFDATRNVFIEGENLETLKLLYKPYYGQVRMIYIDPPYNTGKEFIYPDSFSSPLDCYLRLTGQKDAAGNHLTSNPETSGRYHSAWLSMMYPRLFLARQLLQDDGVIFVSIDDHEVHNLRMLMNEVFGEENLVASIIWQHSVQPKGYVGKFSVHHNYILMYRRSEAFEVESLERTEEHNRNYANPDNDPRGPWRSGDVRNALYRPNLRYDITTPSGKKIRPPENGWRWSKETVAEKIRTGEIIFSADETRIIRKIYLATVQGRVPETIWFGKEAGTTRDAAAELKTLFDGDLPFDTAKPTQLIQRMLQIATQPSGGDIILDFFAGSASTAHAVWKQNQADGGNRRFICVQLQEPLAVPEKKLKTISDIGEERLRHAAKQLRQAPPELALQKEPREQDLGFKVFRLSPSNYRAWEAPPNADPDAYAKQLAVFRDPLIAGWLPEHVIWEVALKEGFGLGAHVEKSKIGENTLWTVHDVDKGQTLKICLDDTLTLASVRKLGLARGVNFVCRDSALNDGTAANLALQCHLITI